MRIVTCRDCKHSRDDLKLSVQSTVHREELHVYYCRNPHDSSIHIVDPDALRDFNSCQNFQPNHEGQWQVWIEGCVV